MFIYPHFGNIIIFFNIAIVAYIYFITERLFSWVWTSYPEKQGSKIQFVAYIPRLTHRQDKNWVFLGVFLSWEIACNRKKLKKQVDCAIHLWSAYRVKHPRTISGARSGSLIRWGRVLCRTGTSLSCYATIIYTWHLFRWPKLTAYPIKRRRISTASPQGIWCITYIRAIKQCFGNWKFARAIKFFLRINCWSGC